MKSKKEDRRVRMTKRVIKDSLIELMSVYPISKISVKMLCETADINRSTFYAHYKDQHDLLKKIQQEVVAEIRQYIIHKYFTQHYQEVALPSIMQVLHYAKENQSLLKVLLSENSDSSFQNELLILAKEKSREEFSETSPIPQQKYLEIFEIAGIVSIIREWLNNDCEGEVTDMAELVTKLLFHGIGSFY